MKRKPPHLFSDRRQFSVAHGVKALEKRQRGGNGLVSRTLEPLERARISAPRNHVEDGAGEIDAMNLWLSSRPEPIARIPQAADDARRLAAGAARALIRGVLRDPLELEAVDRSLGIVARDLVESCVDDGGDARHGYRCFRDVGGDDDA